MFPWTLYESECHERWIPRGSDTSVYPRVWLGPVGVSSARSTQKFMGRRRRRIWKSENGVTATTMLFPHANSRLYLGILSHFAPWNKPIHGLELFQFATVSPVLPTRDNTLDRSRHFEPGTFLNCTCLYCTYTADWVHFISCNHLTAVCSAVRVCEQCVYGF